MGCLGVVRSRPRGDPTAAETEEIDCEVRPGGMLVQKRAEDGGDSGGGGVSVVVRVAHGATMLVVSVGSRATIGELKKLISVETGLQPADQRLIYKGKERANMEFLDLCGVKNRSKVTLVEDPCSIERRYMEMKRNARMECVQRAISDVAMEIDKLADQVTAIEESVENRKKVVEVQISTLTELLMMQAIRLGGIPAEGDACFQKNMQAKRVQKCVETLDVLTVSNARLGSVVVTTRWETFDSLARTNWVFFD